MLISSDKKKQINWKNRMAFLFLRETTLLI